MVHCVNIPHFLYAFFCLGTSGLFPVSGYMNKAAMKMFEHVSLWVDGMSLGYMHKSAIAES